MSTAIEKAIRIAGSQEELAKVARLSQAAISILKNGRNGKPVIPRFSTAKRLSAAIGGKIKWYEFMEPKQGDTEGVPNHGKEANNTSGAGNTAPNGTAESGTTEMQSAA